MIVEDAYGAQASGYDARQSAATRARLERIDAFIAGHVGRLEPAAELGQGTGRLLARLPASARLGFDTSRGMCREAARRGLSVVRADQAHLPLAEASLGAAVSGHAAGRHTPLEAFVAEIARVLRDRGRFGVHLFPRDILRLRALVAPWHRRWRHVARDGGHDLPAWQDTCAIFARAGLWIEGHMMLRNLPLPPYAVRVRPGPAMSLAIHVALVGSRLTRRFVEMRNGALEALRAQGAAEVLVAGESMTPTARTGDRLRIERDRPPRRGDVVLIQARDGLLAHRVLAVAGPEGREYIVHRGDATGARPALAAAWRVIGRVTSIRPLG